MTAQRWGRGGRPGIVEVAGGRALDLPLERYGLIGDSGTAALVSDAGSIDWLCLPRFDSAPVFSRLLDPAGGYFGLAPEGPFSATRRYLPGTAILATTFTTPSGRATVYDFFAARSAPAKRRSLWPFRYLVRRAVGEEGRVDLVAVVEPGPGFGRRRPRIERRGRRLLARSGGAALLCEATAPWEPTAGGGQARLPLRAGQRAHVSAAFSGRDLGVWPPVGDFAEEVFAETLAYWQNWAARAGGAPAAVLRSAITLKLLTYAPSGAVVAAPTTSLPEVAGGVRNWDYRYAWIRDASWSVSALYDLGYLAEARAFLFWATNAATLSLPRVRTMYGLYGTTLIREREVRRLRGYRASRPVRVGNAASDQLQLDNWGHLLNAALGYARRAGGLDAGVWSALRAMVGFVADNWHHPDQGIWEVRGAPQHFVHSKVMCWVALDRGVHLVEEFGLTGPAAAWAREADAVRAEVLDQGVDPDHGNLTRAFGDRSLDASLLLVPIVGFLPPDDPTITRTIERVRAELAEGDLVRRYATDDGLPGREGAFLACSFWLAQALGGAGGHQEAKRLFGAAAGRANDLGLLPEEIDPGTGAFLGNFPQGLSHIALIHAALALAAEDRHVKEPPGQHERPEGALVGGAAPGEGTVGLLGPHQGRPAGPDAGKERP
ncbi:MAG TPA: glycoside hydrolase family 15 protein [Acidimicrobiales bacterium]|nr:glycoside hydrolase family 15 protein [Acidimicrobiales bacterium]